MSAVPKGKRVKQQKHALLHAAVNFGVRAPYTVLGTRQSMKIRPKR